MKLVPVFPELFEVLISWSLSRKEKRQEVLDRKRDKRSLLMWGKILFFFQKYCRHFLFLRIYFCSWKTKKRNSNWCMEASGVGYEAFARRGQVYKRPWTPRRGNEVLIRFHSGVQKKGDLFLNHQWPVAPSLQIQLLFPAGAPVSQQSWNSGCFAFRNQKEPFVLLEVWPWPSAPQPRTKVKWTQNKSSAWPLLIRKM